MRVTFAVTVTTAAALAIVNRAVADDGLLVAAQSVTTVANGQRLHLPVVQRR
jgi:hypothetical protein